MLESELALEEILGFTNGLHRYTDMYFTYESLVMISFWFYFELLELSLIIYAIIAKLLKPLRLYF